MSTRSTAGGSIPDTFTTTGSGSPFVYGVLEDHFREGLSTAEGRELAIRALTVAMKRDSASGDGISLCTIDSSGYTAMDAAAVMKIQAKLAA